MNTFLSRLLWVLGGQEKYPWCERIGVGAGRGNTMFGTRDKPATPPTAEALNAIMRYENVSITWLLDGKGAPCLVNIFTRDGEAARWVAAELQAHSWEVHVLTDRQTYVLVMTRPDRYQVKERHIDYTRVEIVAGVLAGETLAVVRQRPAGQPSYRVDLDQDTLQSVARGQVSNLPLLRSEGALLLRRQPLEDEDVIWQWSRAEPQNLAPDEERLLQCFRSMTLEQRQLFLRVAHAFTGEDEE